MITVMDDDPLLAELGHLIRRADPVPDEATLAARSAFAWRRMDAALAELLEDSAVDDTALAGVRSGNGGWRTLTFEAPDGVSIEVEVETRRRARNVTGQILPAGPARVLVRLPGSEIEVEADDLGRFRAEGLRAGPFSLRCERETGAIETGWVTI
jgi:hypothetical protein